MPQPLRAQLLLLLAPPVLQAPDVMRSCSMALQLLSTAIGSYLGGGLVAAVAALSVAAGQPWLPKDLNSGHLDRFLLLCGGLMLANTLLFVLVANNYEYKVGDSCAVAQWSSPSSVKLVHYGGVQLLDCHGMVLTLTAELCPAACENGDGKGHKRLLSDDWPV